VSQAELCDAPQQEASEEIHDQRTGGEGGASSLLDQALESIARQCSCGAENDE
jgi:hypothetical protein